MPLARPVSPVGGASTSIGSSAKGSATVRKVLADIVPTASADIVPSGTSSAAACTNSSTNTTTNTGVSVPHRWHLVFSSGEQNCGDS